MGKYRKRPVVIDAVRFDGSESSMNDVVNELGDGGFAATGASGLVGWRDGKLIIKTLEGYHEASPGDWIIRGVKGEFYPCKPDIFEMTYEAAPPVREEP
jgi:hypothetical protein